MNTLKNTSSGISYQSPVISLVRLDQEISLTMLSYPEDPGFDAYSSNTPDFLKDDPTLIL